MIKKLFDVYIELWIEAVRGLGFEQQENERKALKEVICQLTGCDEERMDALEMGYLFLPCDKIFNNRALSVKEIFLQQLECVERNRTLFYEDILK